MSKKKEQSKDGAAYLRVVEYLSRQIKENVYPPGARLPSMKELAGKFQVCDSTIKTAFKMLKKENLLRYHYGVGMIVREDLKFPLKIALILPSNYENLRHLLQGMQEALKACAGRIEVMFYRNDVEQDECLKRLKEEDFSGAVIRPELSKQGYSAIRKVQNEKSPIVLIENFYQDSNGWNLDIGAYDAGKASVEYLENIGRLPAGIVCFQNKFAEAFINGYKEAHAKLRLDCHRNNIKYLGDGNSPGQASLDLLKLKNPPHSIIYTNSPDAVAGYKALMESRADLRCIKLISFGEIPNNEFFKYPIFLIKRDFKELGGKAAKLLIEQIKTPKEERCSGKNIKITSGVMSKP